MWKKTSTIRKTGILQMKRLKFAYNIILAALQALQRLLWSGKYRKWNCDITSRRNIQDFEVFKDRNTENFALWKSFSKNTILLVFSIMSPEMSFYLLQSKLLCNFAIFFKDPSEKFSAIFFSLVLSLVLVRTIFFLYIYVIHAIMNQRIFKRTFSVILKKANNFL